MEVLEGGQVQPAAALPPFRVLVATPFGRGGEPEYIQSLWELRGWFATHKVQGYGDQYCDFDCTMGSILVMNRHTLVKRAIEKEATHILFIDSDMNFTVHAPRLLCERHLPLVGCNYLQSTLPLKFTAKGLDGQEYTEQKAKVEEVESLGFGMILIDLNVFSQMPEPWFDMPWENGSLTGEDRFFCAKAREAGVKIMVDNEASSQITHVARMEFSHRMVNK